MRAWAIASNMARHVEEARAAAETAADRAGESARLAEEAARDAAVSKTVAQNAAVNAGEDAERPTKRPPTRKRRPLSPRRPNAGRASIRYAGPTACRIAPRAFTSWTRA